MLWVGFCHSRPSTDLGYYVFDTSRHEALTLRMKINAIILEQIKSGQEHCKVRCALHYRRKKTIVGLGTQACSSLERVSLWLS